MRKWINVINEGMDNRGPAPQHPSGRFRMEIGAIYRRQARRLLDVAAEHGVTYREEKTLVDSIFIVSGPAHILKVVHGAFAKIIDQVNADEPEAPAPERKPRTGLMKRMFGEGAAK